MTKPDTRHLDTAIGILRGSDKAKRAKGTTFSLQVGDASGVLQGPRGKTVKTFYGSPEEQKAQAKAHAEKLGATLTIYE